MYFRKFAYTITVFLVCRLISALIVWSAVPSPPRAINLFSFIGKLFVFCMIGPVTFAWAWGPQPLSIVALIAAVLMPISSLALLYSGWRKPSLIRLAMSAVVWGSFGGFAAYLAVIGTI
jgi:hypothetical protein